MGRKFTRLSETQRDEMQQRVAQMYADGMTIREIATETDRSYGATHRMLEEARVTFRPRGIGSR